MATTTRLSYYEVLEVETTATQDEIKKAYKKKAIQYHPDRNPGDKDSEEKFKQAAEAYNVLSDPDKRSRYDRFGPEAVDGPGGFSGHGMSMDDILNMFNGAFGGSGSFGGFGGFGGFGDFGGGGQQQRNYQGADLRLKVKLTLEEIATGVTKNFKVKKNVACDACHGSGAEAGSHAETCDTCHGSGYVVHTQRTILGMMQSQEVCPTCHGEGTVIKNKCKKCHGDGVIPGEEIIEVKIPAGVAEGMVVNISGKGHAGPRNGVAGNIQVLIEEEAHPTFIRDENDIIYNLLLTIPQATLGAEIQVPTLDGKAKIKIEAGTQPGTVLRLRKKGLPSVRGYGVGTGDLVVNVSVYIPEKADGQLKQAMESLNKNEGINPGAKSKENIFKKFRAYFES